MEYAGTQPERRRADRYPLEADVVLSIQQRGQGPLVVRGRSRDMSSRGLLVATDTSIPCGRQVEAAIAWPAKLDGSRSLKLVIAGRVVREEEGVVAMSIAKTEYRMMGSRGLRV